MGAFCALLIVSKCLPVCLSGWRSALKKTEVLNMRLTPELSEGIKQGAALTGRSVSSFVDQAVNSFLASDDYKKQAANNVAKLNSLLEAKP